MTKDEALKRLEDIRSTYWDDIEQLHIEADRVLLRLVDRDVVRVYLQLQKDSGFYYA